MLKLLVLKRLIKRGIKILLWCIGSLLMLLVVLILLIRLPFIQNYITHQVVSYVSGKTHARMELGRLYIGFPKTVVIERLFASDTHNDTLLAVQKLEIDINLPALLKKKVELNSLLLGGATAYVQRSEDSVYNFAFLIKAFSNGSKKKVEVNKTRSTDTSAWQIQADRIQLENIRGGFIDSIGGTFIKGYVGSLHLNMKAIDIKHLSFTGNDLLLSNTDVSILQTRMGTGTTDTSITLMPLLALHKLELNGVSFLYENMVNGQSYNIKAGKAEILPAKIDLNAHVIRVNSVQIEHTTALIAIRKNLSVTDTPNGSVSHSGANDWQISAGELQLAGVNFNFDITNLPKLKNGVDYNHLGLKNANIHISGASYTAQKITGDVKNISVHEQSGFELKKLQAKVLYDDHQASLQDLTLLTGNSRISNALSIQYSSIDDIGKNPGDLGVHGNFNNTHVAVEDILMFVPQLKTIKFFADNRGKTVQLSGRISGKVKDLTATDLKVALTGGTTIALNAHITGLPDALHAYYDVQFDNLHTTASDVMQLSSGAIPHSIHLPVVMDVSGRIKGSLKNARAQLALKTSEGNADVNATLAMGAGDTFYTATISTRSLNLGYILNMDSLLGPVTMKASASGHSLSPQHLQAAISAQIDSVRFNRYTYANISIAASANKQHDSAIISINDSNLIMNLSAAVSMVKDSEFIHAAGHIEGVDFQQLKLLKQDIRASAYLAVNTTGNFGSLNGSARLDDIIIMNKKDSYRLDSLVVKSINDDKQDALTIRSPVVTADYDGNIPVQYLPAMMIHYINNYFRLTDDTMVAAIDTNDRHFKLDVNVLPHPVIGIVFPGLQNFDGANVTSSFNKNAGTLKLNANVSQFALGSIKATAVHADINSDKASLKYNVSLQSLAAGPVRLAETSVYGSVTGNVAQYALRIHGKDTLDKLLVAGNFKQDSTKAYVLHLDNNGFVLENNKWNLKEDNYVRFGTKGFVIHDLELSNKEQLFSANTPADTVETINIKFRQFQLGSLSQIIERDTELLRGVMDGNVELRNMQHAPAFVSDLQIKNISYLSHPIGNIDLQANNLTADKYTAQLVLSGSDNDVKIKGYYAAEAKDNQLNFKVDIGKLNVNSVEGFSAGQLRRSTGYITGNMTVTGLITQPIFTGDVGFKDVAFNLAYINNYLTLKDEHISIDNKGIYFKSFTILDSLKQKASIAGAVYTSDFKKMRFDIVMNTDHFTVLNTGIKDNDLFFGKVLLNSDIRVTGNESLPIVRVNAKLLDGSRVTVVIPTSKISTDRGEGVVVLTDTATINNLMHPKDTVLLLAKFKGVDVSANLEVTRETTFKLIVDKSSGDSLVVRGDGILSFTMDETGNQSLTGTYNLESGGYRASFQKVIKRELKIQQGGSITWNGSPTDATVDITAVYTVKTSPADLLSSELANAATSERNPYNALVNFNVLMTMKGELLKPDISFKLDMNPEDQGVLGGTVYAKVVSVDNDPSELNKQVFALLVMNKFIPATIGGGGTGSTNYGDVASNLARNSVNQILTNELNALSGRFIKGVDINVGVNANDQYTTSGTTQNTQISASVKKSFFKERLSVQVGTSINVQNDNGAVKGDAQSLTGDVVLEYKVNKDGSLRFKAFRQNQYEDFIDGTVTDTGVGIVYNRDFNKLKELFKRNKKVKPLPASGQKKDE